jgi:hypothetical protein
MFNIRMDVTEETCGNLNMGCVSRLGGSGRFVAIEQGVSSERHSGRYAAILWYNLNLVRQKHQVIAKRCTKVLGLLSLLGRTR